MDSELRNQKGLTVQSRKSSNDILWYYLKGYKNNPSQNPILTQARELLEKGRAEDSLRLIDSLVSKDEKNIEDQGQAYLLKSKIFYRLNKERDAFEEYKKLARINPRYSMKAFGAAKAKNFEQAVSEVEKEGKGRFSVESDPEASEVIVNGFSQGFTPFSMDLPVGRHFIVIKTVNHENISRTVEIQPNKSVRLKEKLVRSQTSSQAPDFVSIDPSGYTSKESLSKLIKELGKSLGVEKVILVTDSTPILGDSQLGAIYWGTDNSKEAFKNIVKEARADFLTNPKKYVDQSVGDVVLHEKKKKAFYKRPVFWVGVGAAAATGGILGVVLGGGAAAAATTGGVIIGL